MPLNRTTILNGKSDEITSRKGKFVMLVILGAHNKELAKIADDRANGVAPPRCVLWADSEPGINGLIDNIKELEGSSELLQMMQSIPKDVLGFAISRSGKIADVLKKNDSINSLRVELAFKKAISAR